MGQYYTPIILDENGSIEYHLNSHDFEYGLKLMEHSWMKSEFVQAVETLLVHEAPRRVVWAGDYADPELDADGNPLRSSWTRDNGEVVEHDVTLYSLCTEATLYRPDVPTLGRTADFRWLNRRTGERLAKPVITHHKDPGVVPNATPQVIPTQISHPFLLNWDRREYVSKRRVPRARYQWDPNHPRAIHPLPLLTAEGNGRGGGDFDVDGAHGDVGLIGRWARDHVSLSSTRPKGEKWTEVHFNLVQRGAVIKAAS